jgi:hypothetical protein
MVRVDPSRKQGVSLKIENLGAVCLGNPHVAQVHVVT